MGTTLDSTPPSFEILPELFDHLPVGVVVLDHHGKVVIFNKAEEELARRQRAKVLGRDFFREIAPCMDVRDLGGRFHRDIGDKRIEANVEFSFAFPHADGPRDVRVRMRSFDSASTPYAMLVIEDLSRERAIERMKTRLNELLVHDLKNPLSVVLATLEFVDQGTASISRSIDVAEALSDGVASVRRLQSMIIDLLDTTRLETNVMPIRRERVDAGAMVREVERSARAAGRPRGVTVESRSPDEAVWLDVDIGLLRRSLENLTDNAVRYAQRLVLAVHDLGTDVAIEVIDDGPGIPQELRGRIFERYVLVAAVAASTMNRGLGLTFVKLAAQAHGGEVTVECPSSGGTIFRLRYPKVAPPAVDAPSAPPALPAP